jgi:hypothetical protein
VNRCVPLATANIKKGSSRQPEPLLMLSPFLIVFLTISTSSLTLISCLSESSSRPWPPHTHICFADESEIRKLIANHFLPDHDLLKWHPATGEDLPTPNTNEIVVFSFFQRGFGLSACDFLHELLDHYQIELVHLNPNSILQIVIFIHLCEAFLSILPNFYLFKNYFFLKYQPSAANCNGIKDVGL